MDLFQRRSEIDGDGAFLIDTKGVIQDAVLADVFIGQHTDFITKAIALNK